ncbi:unnamed protein product [Prunus armeniaca]
MLNGRRTVVEFSLTSRAEWQAHCGRVLTHLTCRTTGAPWSSSHSPLMPNDRGAVVEFSLTSHTNRFSSYYRSLPLFNLPLAWGLGELHDHHHRHTLEDARTRVRMPELKDTSKPPTKKSILDRKLGGLLFVPYLTRHSRHNTWKVNKAETSSMSHAESHVERSINILHRFIHSRQVGK